MTDNKNRVALVTGANKGIGYQVSQELAQAGMTVYMGARDQSRGEEAANSLKTKGLDVRYVALDLADDETMRSAAKTIESEQGRLDVLVNNAGIVDQADGTPGEVDLDGVRRTFDTNFFATAQVTQTMLPLIRKSAAGRIVNVSSGLGSLTLHTDPSAGFLKYRYLGYCASKSALNMFTILLAGELKEAGILVNSADPGYTATDLNGHQGHQTIEEGARETVRLALLPDDGPTGGFFDMTGPRPW